MTYLDYKQLSSETIKGWGYLHTNYMMKINKS